MMKSSQARRALRLLAKQGMVRLREFISAGIAEETIARLVRENKVVRLARGLYQLQGAQVEAEHSMAEAAKLVPKGVICLISALQFHGLTTQLPSQVWMAIDRTTRRPSISYPPIRFVRFGRRALIEGVGVHTIESVSVRVYSPAKAVVDCFRYRNKIGTDVAIEALRDALRKRLCTPSEIWKLARDLRILTVMRPYLEAVAANGA